MKRWQIGLMVAGYGAVAWVALPQAGLALPIDPAEVQVQAQTTAPKGDPEGEQLLRDGKFDDAIRRAEGKLRDDPRDGSAHLLMVFAQLGTGNEQAADEQARLALGTDAQLGAHIYYRIGCLYAAKQRYYLAILAFDAAWKVAPSSDIASEVAKIHLARGQLEPARVWLERVKDREPDYLNLSLIALAQRHLDLATTLGQQAIVQAATNREAAVAAYLAVVSSQLQQDQLVEARATLEMLQALEPSHLGIPYLFGLTDLAAGDVAGAIAHLRAPSVKASDASAQRLAVVAYHLNGELKQAAQIARSLAAAAPGDALPPYLLANIFVSAGHYAHADAAYRKAGSLCVDFMLPSFASATNFAGATSGAMAQLSLSTVFMREGLFTAALRSANAALAASPTTNTFFLVNQATAEAKSGQVAAATKTFAQAQARKPALISSWTASAAWAAEREDFAQAIHDTIQAVKVAPRLRWTRMMLAGHYERAGDLERAIRTYLQLLDGSGGSPLLYNQLAWAMAMQGQDLPQALDYAQKAAEKAPSHVSVLDTLGWVHFLLGNADHAMEVYTKLLKASSPNPTIHYHFGCVYEKLGQRSEAARSFERALNISDTFPEVDAAIAGLARVTPP